MDRETYLSLINAPGVGHTHMEWQTTVTPAAAHRAHTLVKVTTASVLTGVKFADLSENNDRETGNLPWGTWAVHPYVVEHKGKDYFRLNVLDGTIRSIYLVDGNVVDRDTFNGYLTPSAANASRPIGGTITVKAENIRLIGNKAA